MRTKRLFFILLVFYFSFLGGSAYYNILFPVRVLHHAAVTLLLAGWLLARIRSGSGLPRTMLEAPLLAVVAVWFVSALASLDPRVALENIWFPLTHLLLFFIAVDLLQRGRYRLLLEAQFIMAALVVFITLLELASWYFGLGILPGTEIGWPQMGFLLPPTIPEVSLALNISTLQAGYVAPLVTLTLVWGLTSTRSDYRRALYALALLLLLVLLLTGSRGGLLSLLAALGALALIRLMQWPRLTARIPPRLLLAGGLAAALAGAALFVLFTLPLGRGQSNEGRLDMWQSAISMTADHPLLGVGPGLFGRALRDYRDPDLARDHLASAHNAYLNNTAETGLAGLAAAAALLFLFSRQAWRTYRSAPTPARRFRLEAGAAALAGVAAHSMVDVFTVTPVVLVIILLAAYVLVGQRSSLDPVPALPRWTAAAALLPVLLYGLAFIQFDRAGLHYMLSLPGGDNALQQAAAAHELDPHLRLHTLQYEYLTAQQLASSDPDAAVAAYTRALSLEPTWDTGWINLAALEEMRGNLAAALEHLRRAWAINPMNTAPLHWARLAEAADAAPADEIVAAYLLELNNRFNPDLPLADFWWQTALRRQAVELYLPSAAPVNRYRILAAHDPGRLSSLLSDEPSTAADFWMLGEYTLTVFEDPQNAVVLFSQAIELSPYSGDAYASRARAYARLDPAAALADLDMARLLGTRYEYPNALRARLTDDPQQALLLAASALPPRPHPQGFAAVLYAGRPAAFDLFPSMRRPGPGRAVMSPWYDVAYTFLEQGLRANAITAFSAILDYAPAEDEARQQLEALLATP